MEKSYIDHLNKKQKIDDNVDQIFEENGMSIEQRIEYCTAHIRKFSIDWLSTLCSDWVSPLLLKYLTLHDIARVDNHNGLKD